MDGNELVCIQQFTRSPAASEAAEVTVVSDDDTTHASVEVDDNELAYTQQLTLQPAAAEAAEVTAVSDKHATHAFAEFSAGPTIRKAACSL